MSDIRIDRVVTSGTFSLDGGTWDVDNNVWVIGDDAECVVIDAAHDGAAIDEAIAGRRLTHILCTHGHDDHIDAVGDLVGLHPNAQVLIHDADRMLWDREMSDPPDGALTDGQSIGSAGPS